MARHFTICFGRRQDPLHGGKMSLISGPVVNVDAHVERQIARADIEPVNFWRLGDFFHVVQGFFRFDHHQADDVIITRRLTAITGISYRKRLLP